LLTDKLKAPNGIAFAPSERTLYVSDTLAAEPGWVSYDVSEDGMLSEPTGFVSTPAWARTQPGARDGLKTDQFGNISPRVPAASMCSRRMAVISVA
jgi:gluconolactonase